MAKKPSGLGRGLGELLEDNSPQPKQTRKTLVIVKDKSTEEDSKPRDLYDQGKKPKNKSLKSNYR